MKRQWRFAGILALSAMAVSSCEATTRGQIILSVQTDMSLPKDLDRIRIIVHDEDARVDLWATTFARLGEPDNIEFRLPATIAIVAAKEKSHRIRVSVIGFRGTLNGDANDPIRRVVHDVVTTMPKDRVVTLPVLLEFLCDGTTKIKMNAATGKPARDPETQEMIYESTCGAGQTCKAGKCASEVVQEESLDGYDAGQIFGEGSGSGDGSCFDTGACFEDAISLDLDIPTFDADGSTCHAIVPDSLSSAGVFNVGIETQGGGMCNSKGCYVALDAESNSGWTIDEDGVVVLPSAICTKFKNAEISRIVGTPVRSAPCAQKRAAIPTCGPWSSTGKDLYTPPDPNAPIILAGGQVNPNSIALHESGIYWTTQGDLATNQVPGAVKMVPPGGGTPAIVAQTQGVPQGLVVDPRGFVLWTDATNDAQGKIGWAPIGTPNYTAKEVLVDDLLQPGSVDVLGKRVFFTELGENRVRGIDTLVDLTTGKLQPQGNATLESEALAGIAPFSVATTTDAASQNNFVCFAYQGTAGKSDGIVACKDNFQTLALATELRTPRSLLFQHDASGNIVALYWVEADSEGAIWRAGFSPGSGFSPNDTAIVTTVSRPGTMAIDFSGPGTVLYYPSAGEGAIKAYDLDKQTASTVIAGRKNPVAIAVDANFIYWVEGGAPNTKEGGIFKMLKQP